MNTKTTTASIDSTGRTHVVGEGIADSPLETFLQIAEEMGMTEYLDPAAVNAARGTVERQVVHITFEGPGSLECGCQCNDFGFVLCDEHANATRRSVTLNGGSISDG